MDLESIKSAVLAGKTVHCSSDSYRVVCDSIGQWLIVCTNGWCCGLTWKDGVTLNGWPEEFYIAGSAP